MQTDWSTVTYAGFGDRLLAAIVDSVVQLPVIVPLLWLLLHTDVAAAGGDPFLLAELIQARLETPLGRLVVYGVPLFYSILFWKFRAATPGKLLMDMKIVDATTGAAPTTGRWILRVLGYVVNVIILCLGFFWIAFDKRKQGLHDKMANTVVIMTPKPRRPQS